MALTDKPLTAAERIASFPVDRAVRARSLLTMLWRRYDEAGISMGRGIEAVILEAAMKLLGPPDLDDLYRLDNDPDFLNTTRSYLSALNAVEYENYMAKL
jgi:hypothetical protein